jgi:hypothetical protein
MITFKDLLEQLQPQQQNPAKIKAAELFSRVYAAIKAGHTAHLMAQSFAQHDALNDFYTGLAPILDKVMENFIGRMGRLESAPPNVNEKSLMPIEIVGNLTAWLDSNRQFLGEFSEIQNLIDEMLSLCNSTAYKLRELN